jgi:hypothetical protein
MSWDSAIKVVGPHVVRIETQNGWGTGFLAFYNHDRAWCGIATAANVVSHADAWQHPLRIRNEASARFLKAEDRVIFLDHRTDSAIVLFFKGELQLPESPIALIPVGEPCSIGQYRLVRFPQFGARHYVLLLRHHERVAGAQKVLLDRRRRH